MTSALCNCENNPHARLNWDIWVSDPNRAFCRSCGRDLHPKVAKREYAKAMAEQERLRSKFPPDEAKAQR